MYVLHHADQPQLYADLPNDPQISPFVKIWKGVSKPLALLGIAAAALTGFLHYVGIGPNETTREDEEAARRELEKPS